MAEGASVPLRRLSWGLILLLIWMGLVAWSGLQNAFFPAPPTAPVYLVDMPWPLLAVNAALLLLPVATLLLLGLGLFRLRLDVPEVRSRLTWHVGRTTLGPLRVVMLILGGGVLAIVAAVAIDLNALFSGAPTPAASLLLDAVFSALYILLGWFLMIISGQTLLPMARGREPDAILAATIVISAGAWLLVAVQFIAAIVGASMLSTNPSAPVPPSYPWADGFSALAACVGLAMLVGVSRRALQRAEGRPVSAMPVGT